MDSNIIYHEIGKDPLYKIWHASDKNMIIYMHSEGGSIVCNEKIFPIQNGVLCFIGAGNYHYTMPDIPEQYERSKILISADKLNKVLNILSIDSLQLDFFYTKSIFFAKVDEENREYVDSLFRDIKRYEDDDKYSEIILLSSCLKLLVLLDKFYVEKISAVTGFMNKAIEYINNNIFHEIKIEDICSAINISKYHFCRQFKKNTGMTVMEYILKTRIILAKNILLTENVSILEVSERCGFSSISYFCRAFKSDTGKSPLKYRKQHSAHLHGSTQEAALNIPNI